MKKYKSAVVTKFGGPEVIKILENDYLAPSDGFVGVNIEAAGVSPVDILMREGVYWGVPQPPFTLGYDFVGRVSNLGNNVTRWKVGDRVAGMPMLGGNSEYICVDERELVAVPEVLRTVDAVCLVFNYLTAYQILHRVAKVQPKEKILIHGAGGGVGSAMIELGKLLDLELYGCDSSKKQEFIKKLGAIPIDYTKNDFIKKIHQLTKNGVDVVVDGIGGWHLLYSYGALCGKGRLVAYGFSAMLSGGHISVRNLIKFYLGSLPGVLLGIFPFKKRVLYYRSKVLQKQHLDWFREDVTQLFKWAEEKKLNPVIANTLSLEQIQKVHEMIGANMVQGKIVLIINK